MSRGADQPGLPERLVRNANFVLLWGAYGVAAVGDHLSEMALLASRDGLSRPDSTRIQALITFGFFLPFVLLGPLAGWWSDRFSRKWTMVAADLLRALVVFNLAGIVTRLDAWLAPRGLGDFSIVLPLVVVGTLAAFFSPARQAMLPTLIREDQLVQANALISALGTIGTIVAAVLGGYLVQTVGPVWNFRINALTFALSAVLVTGIALSRARVPAHHPQPGVWRPLLHGFRYVRQHRRVLQMILLAALFWAAAGVVISVVPALTRPFFGADYRAAGLYRGIIGVGLASGALVMTLVGPALPLQAAVLIALGGAVFWLGTLALATAAALGPAWTGVALFGIGGAGAALLVTITAALQRFVPDSRRGRVFGVSDMATMAALVATTGLLGLPHVPDLDRFVPGLLSLTGLALAGSAVVAWRRYRRGDPLGGTQRFLWWLVRCYARLMCRLERVGPCTVPRHGPVIIAANHTSGVDAVCIIASVPYRLVSFLVAEEYYRVPGVHWFMKKAHCVPIDRRSPGKSFLVNCLAVLREGGCLGIFPQGTFEQPGQPRPPPRSGIGVLALRGGAVVVPCHISGTRYRDNPFVAYVLRHRVRIRFGPPIDLAPLRGGDRHRDAAEEATRIIWEKVLALDPARTSPGAPGAVAAPAGV